MNETILTFTINDKQIVLHKDSEVLVQIGKGRGSYKNRYVFTGKELGKAVFYFNCINVGHGYKKRLIIPSLNNPIIARVLN